MGAARLQRQGACQGRSHCGNTPFCCWTGRPPYATWDLDWMEAHYDSVPYGNRTYTTTDQDGNFLGAFFRNIVSLRGRRLR